MTARLFLNVSIMALAALLLGACGGDDDASPGSSSQATSLLLAGGKQGSSGGFVDVDGDGTPDKVIGAPSASKDSSMGVALVYKGESGGHAYTFSTALTGDNSFGSAFENLGDVDGDSKEDFAIGSLYGEGDDVSMSGSIHIFKGGSNGQLIKKIPGEGVMDRFGMSIAAGDLNNDGKNDLIVGAPFNTSAPELYQQGAAYVYLAPDFTTSVALHASSTHKGLGWKVASGDINNDGISDLLISAAGKVLGYYGGGTFAPVIGSPDLIVSSAATDFGKAIAVIGDVDGDGYNDIAIGAAKATINNNRDTGSVYIVKGGTGVRTINLGSVTTDQIVRIDGTALFDRFGSTIVAVDADGDDMIDIAVGAPTADKSPYTTVLDEIMVGQVYVFKGMDISSTTTLADAMAFPGGSKYEGFGTMIAAGPNRHILVGMPAFEKYTGDSSVIDLTTLSAE